MAKIFIREQSRVGKVQGTPRFALLGVEGSDRKFFQIHVCKSEFDTIAQSIAAEVAIVKKKSIKRATKNNA